MARSPPALKPVMRPCLIARERCCSWLYSRGWSAITSRSTRDVRASTSPTVERAPAIRPDSPQQIGGLCSWWSWSRTGSRLPKAARAAQGRMSGFKCHPASTEIPGETALAGRKYERRPTPQPVSHSASAGSAQPDRVRATRAHGLRPRRPRPRDWRRPPRRDRGRPSWSAQH